MTNAAPAANPDDLVRLGNAAFERGDYGSAVGCYEKAEALITDPGLVAFNKGASLYRLDRYREAELHYRRCLSDATGPRRGASSTTWPIPWCSRSRAAAPAF